MILLTACGTSKQAENREAPPDTIAPVITLIGEGVIALTVGDSYTDKGATASDNKDGNITSSIITLNEVDTSQEGTYQVTYNVQDAATNNAAEVSRTVIINSPEEKAYAALGAYEVERYPEAGLQDDYVVYYPKEGIKEDMPVVLFLEGGGSEPKVDDYRGLMRFMAAKGYFVIGAESGGSYDSALATSILDNALNLAKSSHSLSMAKLAVMRHSQGGGQAFYTMKYFRDTGYGEQASLILSIDGWFAFSMNEDDLNTLDSITAFIQMNGTAGTGTDPRIDLSIWNLMGKAEKKYFLTLPENNHSYVVGDLEDILEKEDLLHIVAAITDDTFGNSTEGYASIPSVNKASYADIYTALTSQDQYSGDCAGTAYNASAWLSLYDVDYCEMR